MWLIIEQGNGLVNSYWHGDSFVSKLVCLLFSDVTIKIDDDAVDVENTVYSCDEKPYFPVFINMANAAADEFVSLISADTNKVGITFNVVFC